MRQLRYGLPTTLVLALATAAVASGLFFSAPQGHSAHVSPGVTATIPVGEGPSGVDVNPATDRIYVTNIVDDTISVIDGGANSVVATIPVAGRAVGVNPATDRIYVALFQLFGPSSVFVIDGGTNGVIATVFVGEGAAGVGVNPATDRIYVSNSVDGTVSVIDGGTNAVIATIPVGTSPDGVGVNPATNRIYVINRADGTVSVIDGGTNAVIATIPVGAFPRGVGVNPTTNRVYVSNRDDGTVSVIDGGTNAVIATIPVSPDPSGVGVNPATNRIYVSKLLGPVSVIDGGTNAVIATVAVGFGNFDVGVNPTTDRVYVPNQVDDTVSVIGEAPPTPTPTPVPSATPTPISTPPSSPTPTPPPSGAPRMLLDMDPSGNGVSANPSPFFQIMTVGSIDRCATTNPGSPIPPGPFPPAPTYSTQLIVKDVEDLIGWQARFNYDGTKVSLSSFNETPFTSVINSAAVGFTNLPFDLASSIHRPTSSASGIINAGLATESTVIGASYLGTPTLPVSTDTPSKATHDESTRTYDAPSGGVLASVIWTIKPLADGDPSVLLDLDDNSPNAPGSQAVFFTGSGTISITIDLAPSDLTGGFLGVNTACTVDSDGDTVQDPDDNCPNDPNSDQADMDDDSIGDVCDPQNTVPVDIKPGSDPNSINAASQGLIPVAILSTGSFDATTVDGTTVQFGPSGALPAHDQTDSANLADHQRDVDGDGLTDYVLHFLTGLTGISEGDTEACLTAQTFGGIAIAGCDAVRMVPPWLDSDGDGFGDAVEATLTTDQFAACPVDTSHDANPADINNDGFSDITDIAALASWFGQPAPLLLPRYDLKPDGFVDISDITKMTAFFGQSCV